MSAERVIGLANKLVDDLGEENAYLQAKCGSLEEGLFQRDKEIYRLKEENDNLKRQVKETMLDINVMIEVSAPNTEKISALLDLKEKIIETFGEWVIE